MGDDEKLRARMAAHESPRTGTPPPQPDAAEGSAPAVQPGRVLHDHWAGERDALIAERAALLAERESLLDQRAALAQLREAAPPAGTQDGAVEQKGGWLGRRRDAASVARSERSAAEEHLRPRHAAAVGQPPAPALEPVAPFDVLRLPDVQDSPTAEPEQAVESAQAVEPAQVVEPEPGEGPGLEDPADVEADEAARTGWPRRTLGWLLAPAEQAEQSEQPDEASSDEPALSEQDVRVRAPEEQGLPPWRQQPDVEPVPAAAPELEPAERAPASAAVAEPTPASADVEPKPLRPGTDLPRTLAAANAAARARALAAPAYDFPEDDDAALRHRATGAFVRPSGPRPAGIAREPDAEPAKTAPLRTGTAFAQRNSAPADVDADEPAPRVGNRHWVSGRGMLRLLIVLVLVVLIAVLLRTYVIAPYYIPSASMEPTLHGCKGCNNDHVLVDKLSYKMHDIHRGDVVVFRRPHAWQVDEKVLVKRVIGLPGDTLTARNGIVYVNGLALDEPYVDRECQSGTSPFTTVTVPDGRAFVMGDNRCDSSDSRRFGAIADSDVIGRAALIIWPLGRLHWL